MAKKDDILFLLIHTYTQATLLLLLIIFFVTLLNQKTVYMLYGF